MYSELTTLLRSQGGKGRAEMLFPFILLMIIKKGLRMTDTIIGIISIGIAGLVMVFLLIKICGG